MNVFILEIGSTASNSLETKIRDLLLADGIAFAEEQPSDSTFTNFKAYSYEKTVLKDIQYKLEKISSCITMNTNQIDDSNFHSGWSEEIVSSWESDLFSISRKGFSTPESPKIPLVLKESNIAFGDGNHITTSLILKELESHIASLTPPSFLDFGSGSGILAIAASLLGIETVWACECDQDALTVSKDNGQANGIKSINFVTELPEPLKPFDLICCNIQPPLLTEVLPQLKSVLSATGTMILSGYTSLDSGLIAASQKKLGLQLCNFRQNHEWIASSWVSQSEFNT